MVAEGARRNVEAFEVAKAREQPHRFICAQFRGQAYVSR